MKIRIVAVLLLLINFGHIYAQQQDIVKTQGITSPMHQANIGKIIFTSESIPIDDLNVTDILKSYELTNKSDLFIIVFMGNSITNYMHNLAPELSAGELVKTGNYQFSLFVDNHLIYSSNLMPGAPYDKIQDTATTIDKPLINNKNPGGLWSQSFWGRFMNNGGDSVLTEGDHLLKMEIKPYVQTAAGAKVGDLIASGSLIILVKRKPVIDITNIRLNVPEPYNGFPVSTDTCDTNLLKTLKANINEGVFKTDKQYYSHQKWKTADRRIF